ncbi:pigment-dispersing factor receptor isoform X2 [Musca autumnalis]|uniref:pigment-dispersing factor receptor isoform X2 n=1 Tax=Musca autumnalis TaxID=221902 RepID=UPI003CF2ACD1
MALRTTPSTPAATTLTQYDRNAEVVTSSSILTDLKSSDLNFAETLHKAAVKLLTKRSVVIQNVIETKGGSGGGGGGAVNEAVTTQQHLDHHSQPTTTVNVIMDRNLAESIATIRKNVTRVLQMYFRQINETTTGAIHQQQQQHEMPEAISSSSNTTTQQLTNDIQSSGTTTATNSTPTQFMANVAATMTSEVLQNSTNLNSVTYYNTNLASSSSSDSSSPSNDSNNVISTTISHLTDIANATLATTTKASETASPSLMSSTSSLSTLAGNITYPSYGIPISSAENCSAIFSSYKPPQTGLFCNWTWDMFTCWPPTPAGALAHMGCPSGFRGVDARKFANRKCELNGHWGSRPHEPPSANGWTDYNPCFKPEVKTLLDKVPNLELVVEIAKRTRTLEIVGLILSLVALILSLIIFCNFRSLRNNRTKIHKNLFIAMGLQVIIRLSLYLDQAIRRDKAETTTGIEDTLYLCETSYILLEYAKTAMFMWMFIEGWYLHNMVTVSVFQGRFPYKLYSIVGWGVPVLMTTVWAICTAFYYADTTHDCWGNYNLTPYYWILEGPRIVIITINFAFLLNIIAVLVMKLRESQASDIEQTRKAVRAAIVLLPLLGTINILYLVPTLETPWKFALWSYVTHFLNTFQGFFIALIYCFLNGEVRAVLLKSLAVFMSVRGHPEWVPKRASMYSAGYNTAHDTENHHGGENKRNGSPSSKRLNGRKGSCSTVIHHQGNSKHPKIQKSPRLSHSNASGQGNHLPLPTEPHHAGHQQRLGSTGSTNNNNGGDGSQTSLHSLNRQLHHVHHHHLPQSHNRRTHHSWLLTICFRGQKVLRVPPASTEPPETNV